MAATANKMGGINKILGAFGTTAASLSKNVGGNDATTKALTDHLVSQGVDADKAKEIASSFQYPSPLTQTVEENPSWTSPLGADISISDAAASPLALKQW
jgi:hypothetical protein